MYKKLLNGRPTLTDLRDAQPSLAKGLQALLDYEGDDVESVFCHTFEVEYVFFDSVRFCLNTPDPSPPSLLSPSRPCHFRFKSSACLLPLIPIPFLT
jgi:hypothetical protein